MFNKYSKILIAVFIVTLFFACSVLVVSANANGEGQDSIGSGSANFFDGGGHHEDNPCEKDHYGDYNDRNCIPKQGDCDDKDRDHDDKCPTPTPAPIVAAPSTNTGGPGDGLSDNLGCSTHDCSGNQVGGGSSTQTVLGAATGPQVLGLSYTSGEESFLPQLLQLFGALTSGGLGLVFFKKNG